MRLVYLSPVPWESFFQRPHHFVQWFNKYTEQPVLWVDPYLTRFPRVSDLKRLFKPFESLSLCDTPSWLTVIRPSAAPIEPLLGSGYANRYIWRDIFSNISTFLRAGNTIFVIGKPSVLALDLLKHFQDCPSLYDAMDNFSAFYSGISRFSLARREQSIAEQVNIVWTSSTALYNMWVSHCDDVRLVHNGFDPTDLPSFDKSTSFSGTRVFGYVGTIARWFDWDWLYILAEARPNDEIRLVGPVFDPPEARLPPNVILYPACDHRSALKSMTEFDVGLIPFKRNKLTMSVDPIKYYEYRALSLPVISTDFGEMCHRHDIPGVYICKSPDEIASVAEAALRFEQDSETTQRFLDENSWDSRFNAAKLF